MEYINIGRVIIYFLVIFVVDLFGFMNLYGQNLVRRMINMYRRRDYLTYYKKLNPYCKAYRHMIDKKDLERLNKIKIPEKKDVPWFTRRNTTTYQCCENYNKEERKTIHEIVDKIKVKYERHIGKKLYNIGTKATIYVYHGSTSQHLWHVDPQNISEIYNLILCFKKEGEISPLQCKDNQGNKHSIHFEPGDAAMFKGGTTIHQVPPNKDDNSKRYVLSVKFTSDKNLTQNSNNMCTYIEGGNNYINLIKVLTSILILNIIAYKIAGVDKLDYKFLLSVLLLVMLTVKYIPMYFDTSFGSGRSSSIIYNIGLVMMLIMITLSPKGGILFFSYFALSDVFFPSSLVAYD
jgi:hypothetical protein